MDKPHLYIICVTIIEGRQFAIANMDSVVHVRVGDQKKNTNVQHSTDSPYFNEYFVFEFNKCLEDLLDMQLNLTIIQPRKIWRPRKILGHFNIDMSIVWSEPQHQFYHKWAIITAPPNKNMPGPVGYVKMDICILSKGEVPHYPRGVNFGEDDIEKNLLLPENVPHDRPRANFIFNIYRAEGIPKIKKNLLKKTLDSEQQPSTYIEISFGGLTVNIKYVRLCTTFLRENCVNKFWDISLLNIQAKTSIKKNNRNPVWNERIVITQLFPPLCERISIELKFPQNSELTMKNYIYLKAIANKGENGFLPTFGPSYIYFYTSPGSEGEYCGKLLLEINTEILNDLIWSSKCTNVQPFTMLPNLNLWRIESILLFCTIYSVTMIDKKLKDTPISFEIGMGNISGDTVSKDNMTLALKPNVDSENHYCYLPLNGQAFCLKFTSKWHDVRRRMYNINMIEHIRNILRSDLEYIETLFECENYRSRKEEINNLLLKCLEKLEANCRIYLNISKSIEKSKIKLEAKKFETCLRDIEEIEQIAQKLVNFKSRKKLFRKLQKVLVRLHDLHDGGQASWPDIILSMYSGSKRVSAFRLPARKIIFSNVEEEKGLLCGVMNEVYLKPNIVTKDSSSISCKIIFQMWLGLTNDSEECLREIPRCFEMKKVEKNVMPSSLVCEERYNYICKVYIYEGRFMPGADKTGLADPYVTVILNEKIDKTKAIPKTLNPVWDQTLFLQNIVLYGSLEYLKQNTPRVVMEVYDLDIGCLTVTNQYVGRCNITPEIQVDSSKPNETRLKWYKLDNGELDIQGEILVAAELLLDTGSGRILDEPEPVPRGIKPRKEKLRLDVYFWGVHDLKKIGLTTIRKPKIVIEIGGTEIHSSVIQNPKKCLNFENPYHFADIILPYEKEYYPTLIIKMINCCNFGWYNYIGASVSNIQQYVYNPMTLTRRNQLILEGLKIASDSTSTTTGSSASQQTKSEIRSSVMSTEPDTNKKRKFSSILFLSDFIKRKKDENAVNTNEDKEDDDINPDYIDWWARFHISLQCASIEDLQNQTALEKAYKFKVYNSELETQPEFNSFNDMYKTFEIYRGKRTGDEILDADNIIATFKGAIRIYRWPPADQDVEEYVIENGLPLRDGSFQHFPTNEPVVFVVRVYVIRGINLTPKDTSGKSDPYIKIAMGDKLINDKDRYVPNQVNPVFGRCYELKGTFPFDKLIEISVWDRDISSSDDLIGETKIDIEKRLYTKHRATCGIPYEYYDYGPCIWRDQHKPSQILEILCKSNGIADPEYCDTSIKVGPCVFSLDVTDIAEHKNTREMLGLLALQHWKEIPVVGCSLVPEHVETRSLYHPYKPGLEQGKLQLWIDLFPVGDIPPPLPVDITPKLPQLYELRVIIWNTEDVILDEDDFFIGEKKSDIYVKGWLFSPAQSQNTDVHYNSLTGEGNFNWRFVFPFYYLATEDKFVIREKKSVFSWDATEHKVPCKLTMQVWDNDTFCPDDFLGSVSLHLSRMPRGAKSSKLCTMKMLDGKSHTINLFKIKRHKGWWPFKGRCSKKNKHILTGKVEAEFHLLTEEEALSNPAGLGRSDPQKLPEPKRPDISFSWFRSPLKALKFLVCKRFRCQMLMFLLIIMLVIMALIAIYAFPSYAVKRMLGA